MKTERDINFDAIAEAYLDGTATWKSFAEQLHAVVSGFTEAEITAMGSAMDVATKCNDIAYAVGSWKSGEREQALGLLISVLRSAARDALSQVRAETTSQ